MSPRSTFAMVQTAPRRLEPREIPLPPLRDDLALLRLEACGLCGSDLEQWTGVLPLSGPTILGHEPVGVIEEAGDAARRALGVEPGTRVAVENMVGCGACATCRGGRPHLCRRRRIYGFVPLTEEPGLWGAYARHMVLAPGTVVHPVDPALPAEVAVLFNPLGAGVRWATEIPPLRPGDAVVVLGPGQRGLACVAAARAAGAGPIAVTGLPADAHKLALARALGADLALDVEADDVRARVRELTGGRGAEVVVEVTANATQPVADALDLVAPGGTVVLAGVKGGRPVPGFVSDKVVGKEITLRGAIGVSSSAYRRALAWLGETDRAPLERMHTHDFPLRDAELALRTLAGEAGEAAIAVCLHMEDPA